jgi:hypothetical protein
MAIPFKVIKGDDLPVAMDAAAAAMAPEVTIGDDTSPATTVISGGDTTGSLSKGLRAGETTDDDYNDVTIGYTTDLNGNLLQQTLPSLSDSRAYAVAASLFNCAIYAGGQDEKGTSDVVEWFSGQGGHGTLTSLSERRTDLSALTLLDMVAFVGGNTGSGATDTVDFYGGRGLAKRIISSSLPKNLYGMASLSLPDGTGITAGGRNSTGIAQTDVFQLTRDLSWGFFSNLSVARYNAAAARVYNPNSNGDNYILVAGGKNQHDSFLDTIDVFDMNGNVVPADIKLSEPRSRLVGATVGGYAFFIGGVNGVSPSDTYSAVVDIFDWKLQFVGTLKLNEARSGSAVSVQDDKIIVMGGYSKRGGASSAVDIIQTGSSPTPDEKNVEFDWTSDTEVKDGMSLPASISAKAGSTIYAKDLPDLPVPDAGTTTVTGWYLDIIGETLIDNTVGAQVPLVGSLTLYAKAKSSLIKTINFDYALGQTTEAEKRRYRNKLRVMSGKRALRAGEDDDDDEVFVSPEVGLDALDRTILAEADADVLPDNIVVDTTTSSDVVLPTADEIDNILPGTSVEREFVGWSTEPVATEETMVTDLKNVEEDTTVYAVTKEVDPTEFVDVVHKLADPVIFSDTGVAAVDLNEAAAAMPAGLIVEPADNPLDAEWHDTVVKGEDYVQPALTVANTENVQPNPEGAKYSDDEAQHELTDALVDVTTPPDPIYEKLTTKPDVIEEGTDADSTNIIPTSIIEFGVDDANPDEEAICPNAAILPDPIVVTPFNNSAAEALGFVDTIKLPNPTAVDGMKFEGYYRYDEDGEKEMVDEETFIPEAKETLYPEYKLLDNPETEVSVSLICITPLTAGVQDNEELEKLTNADVPENPFVNIGDNITLSVGDKFDPSKSIDFGTDITTVFAVIGFYTMEPNTATDSYNLVEYVPGEVSVSLTLYVAFKQKMPEPTQIAYVPDPDPDDESSDLAAPALTDDMNTGGDTYVQRPADLETIDVVNDSGESGTLPQATVVGYLKQDIDTEETEPYDPTIPLEEGETVTIIAKTEALSSGSWNVVVDYFPQGIDVNNTPAGYNFMTPLRSALPVDMTNGTTHTMPTNSTVADILAAIGTLPYVESWEPSYHDDSATDINRNPYFFVKKSDVVRVAKPLNTTEFTGLSEDIIVFPSWKYKEGYTPSITTTIISSNIVVNPARYASAAATTSVTGEE